MSKDLHEQIMNIACRRADDTFLNQASRLLYKEGHRDARHDAAELALAASGGNAAPGLTDDDLYNFWLYRDCMDAIRAGDMRAQFINAARAAIAASAPNAALVAALEQVMRPYGIYDVAVCNAGALQLDFIEVGNQARAALSAAGQEVKS